MTTLRHDRAVVLAELGHSEDAVAGLVAAREGFLGERDRLGVAACDHNLSFVLHDLGAFDDAIEYLTEARDIFLAIGMDEEAAACDQNLGVVLYDLGRFEEAGRRFAVAAEQWVRVAFDVEAGRLGGGEELAPCLGVALREVRGGVAHGRGCFSQASARRTHIVAPSGISSSLKS